MNESQRRVRELSDEDLKLLCQDIVRDEKTGHLFWRFDEQQADPIHQFTRFSDIFAEMTRRDLSVKLGNRYS